MIKVTYCQFKKMEDIQLIWINSTIKKIIRAEIYLETLAKCQITILMNKIYQFKKIKKIKYCINQNLKKSKL